MIHQGANSRLEKITDKMLASYARQARTHRVGQTFMPSRTEIIEIIQLCRQVFFPGYFGLGELTEENVRFHVGGLLVALDRKLTEQIYRCLCYAKGQDLGDGCRGRARELAEQLLLRLDEIRDLLNLDVEAAYDGDPAAKSFDEIIFCYPGFLAITVYRVAHALVELGVPLMPRIMGEWAHGVTGVDIHPGATIGKRFFIDHGTGVVVGETTEIGDNVKMYQGVTLGALSFPKDERGRVIKGLKRHPTLEDNVTVYANATILGGQTVIGQGVTVGGNTFVISSVTADSLVSAKPQELQLKRKKHQPRSKAR
jgi:serine O-acetyltransferase